MDEVQQVREKIDIVQLISEYIPLKKMGRNFKANCPFHGEKTPSFVVSPERQIWHCFGCGKGGDAFTFLMEYEHMEFGEALRTLAKKVGVTLKQTAFQSGMSSQKEKIYGVNSLSAEFYHYVLTKHPAGKKALEYLLKERGLNPKLLDTFMIGFAPGSGVALSDYLLRKKGYARQELLDAGLVFTSSNPSASSGQAGVRDFFRDRIMFPLTDVRGNIVGFSGRVLFETQNSPKYINTRETLTYHKGDLFFGLQNAKDAIKKLEQAIVVEGEFDAIALFSQGVANAVAIKGTALTENQVTILSRLTPKVTLCFDQDSAGYEATKKSVVLLEKKGLATTVVVFENAKDADEAIKKNPLVFKKALKNDVPIYDFLLSRLMHQYNKNTADGKKKITDELLPLLAQIDNEVVKEHYVKNISSAVDTSYESMSRQIDRIAQKKTEDKISFVSQEKKSRQEILENYLLSLLVQHENPKNLFAVLESFNTYEFAFPVYQKLFVHMKDYCKDHTFKATLFAATLPQELLPAFDAAYLFPLAKLSESVWIEEVEKIADELATIALKEKIAVLSHRIKEGESKGIDTSQLEKECASLVGLLQKQKN